MNNALIFQPVTWQDYDLIYPYTSAYGENSCQHSPVSMASLSEKYCDSVCIRDNFLYTLRKNLCDDNFRVYLAPLGNGDLREAFIRIFQDAESHNRRVKFVTLTERYSSILQNFFPDKFDILENRDMAEYIYRAELMGSFKGSALRKRRYEVKAFWREYQNIANVSLITHKDFPEILEFEKFWINNNRETHDVNAIKRESRVIETQLKYFDEMRLSGVIMRINNEIKGFTYGTKLNDSCYDTIEEKADRTITNIYRALRLEAVKLCASDCSLINYEEDVGVPGLRVLKSLYKPEFLLRKYIATER